MGDDAIGCLIGGAVVIFGGYWLYTHYEIRKRVPDAPVPIVSPQPLRPTGISTVDVDDEGAVWRVDADTVKGLRSVRQGWSIVDNSKKKGAKYDESRSLYQVNCDTTLVRILSTIIYDKKGNATFSESHAPEKAEVKYYPPGTRGDSVVKYLCDNRFDLPQERVPPPIVTVNVPSPKD